MTNLASWRAAPRCSALRAGALSRKHYSLFVCAATASGLGTALRLSPLLSETIVDAQFRGTSYQAANWIYLGETSGRGRMDRHHEAHGRAVKRIYVYSLCRDAQRRLADSGFGRNKTLGNGITSKRTTASLLSAFLGCSLASERRLEPVSVNVTNLASKTYYRDINYFSICRLGIDSPGPG